MSDFEHPSTEAQIAALVRRAHDQGLQVRVRGAAHSMGPAIYTDGQQPVPKHVNEQNPPDGSNINIMLDRFRGLNWIDEENGIVEAEAGIHLGHDPRDPAGTSTLENSLLHQIFTKGWTLSDLGGITHQTVGGFLSTGSSGGSIKFGIDENIIGFRVIDGQGNARWFERGVDEEFNAFGVSLGLLGIITKVRLELKRAFDIKGEERTTPASGSQCPIDLFGPGSGTVPSLRKFMEDTDYTRILWWPQQGGERIVTWQAERTATGGTLKPYRNVGDLEQLLIAIFFTIAGNIDDLSELSKKMPMLRPRYREAARLAVEAWGVPKLLSGVTTAVASRGWFIDLVLKHYPSLRDKLRKIFPRILDLFQPITKPDDDKGFRDHAWRSLPMDNGADDTLLRTDFTELWIPIERTQDTMRVLKEHFDAGGIPATGYFATELYASKASEFWLSPSYKSAVFRVDPFWYSTNPGDPTVKGGFFAKFWDLLRANDIPFRLHWGKGLPDYDHAGWAKYFESQYPRWKDFMALRAVRDPKNVFLTGYWRRHLGI